MDSRDRAGLGPGHDSVTDDRVRRLVVALRSHYLASITCDHERQQDNPICACSLVHLGWHASVGAAVDAWIDHVLAVLDGDDPAGIYREDGANGQT